LAELRSRLETLTRARPSPEATFREVSEAVADLDRVIAIFNALLRLAEIDSGARLSGFRQVHLAEIAAEVIELYSFVAEEKAIALTLDADPDLVVVGDPFLLAQAIGNLVDNAVKYCTSPGAVTLKAGRRKDGAVEIRVSDSGPGIPDGEKPLVTDLFYRGAASGATAGAGLGLSLVVAVTRLHGGSLDLGDAHPGLVATITLPASAGQ
jgi:signal transduction histidine kinase